MSDEKKPDESKLIAERRGKLDALREQGNAYPNDFRRNATAGELQQTFREHDDETLRAEDVHVAVVGRMMVKRVMGKASFIKLQDRSGQIQLRLERDRLPEGVYQSFKKWDVGDIVGAQGVLMRTQTGELTVLADEVRLLTKSLRPLPEKWAGLSDQETRYRQRYVDLIINEKSREVFRKRSQIVSYMRAFLEAQDFLEGKTDDDLMDVRLKPPNDLRLEQQLMPGPDGWHIGTCRSYLQSGLGYQLNHDAQIAYLITNSDGNTGLRDVIGSFASQGGLPTESVSRPALQAAKLLLGYGLMLPAG